jgi:hypothetical protein
MLAVNERRGLHYFRRWRGREGGGEGEAEWLGLRSGGGFGLGGEGGEHGFDAGEEVAFEDFAEEAVEIGEVVAEGLRRRWPGR